MKLSASLHWELGIGILEDNVFSQGDMSAPFPVAERRREPRMSLSLPVRYRAKAKGFNWNRAYSVDVSRNGIRLALDHPLSVGTRIDLHVKLPEIENAVRLQGVIVWTNKSDKESGAIECGVAFQNLRRLSNKERIMHFMADKICGLAHQHSKELTSRPAESLEDLKKCYELVYTEYSKRGYCQENLSKLHYNAHCVLPESRTFMLERDGYLLGTISLAVDSPWKMPLDSLFNEEINTLRRDGRKVAEVGLLALNTDCFDKKSFSLTDFQKLTASFRLFKVLFDYSRLMAGVTDLIIGMHPKHKELYEYLTFQAIGPVKSYPGACGKPALLMCMDIEHSIQTVSIKQGPGFYFLQDPTPMEEIKKRFSWGEKALLEMLINNKNLWQDLSPERRDYLAQCYPQVRFP